MIASLGMYDRPELHGANDRLWKAIRAQLGFGPDDLSRDGDMWEIWQSPDLLLAQTCGMPFRTHLQGKVQLVGTPDYGLTDTPAGYYYSVIVVGADSDIETIDQLYGKRFAYNDDLSQSGWAAPWAHLPRGFQWGPAICTGAHAASAKAVSEGRAEFAALDAVTWRLLVEHEGMDTQLRVLARTEPTPGLPLITSLSQNPDAVAKAVVAALETVSDHDKSTLGIKGLCRIPEEDYLAIANPTVSPNSLT